MDWLKNLLSGYGTYTVAWSTIVGLWAAYLAGAPDPSCTPGPGVTCAAVSLGAAIGGTIGCLAALFLRRAISAHGILIIDALNALIAQLKAPDQAQTGAQNGQPTQSGQAGGR